MKYEINFDNNTVEEVYISLYHSFQWSEYNFEDGDLRRNIRNSTDFENKLKELRLFGAEIDVGIYADNGFDRIGYASINGHEFVKNGKFNHNELRNALWQIAHPEKKINERRK